MGKKIPLMIMLLAVLSACATGMKGSILPVDLRPGIQSQLHNKFYPNCTEITLIEVVDIQPPEMKDKKVSVGDKWTEKWKISPCGASKIHPVDFEVLPPPKIKGYNVPWALSFEVKDAE